MQVALKRNILSLRLIPQISLGPGLEVLPVHDEMQTLQTHERPLHLTHFSTDWVGRPGVPLTEAARELSASSKVRSG